MSNMTIWDKVQKTDPAQTKQFNRGGGFKGTAINATWLAKRATEIFGPMGIGWGVRVVEENYRQGAPLSVDSNGVPTCHEIIHVVQVELWYRLPEGVMTAVEDGSLGAGRFGQIYQFGQTVFVGKNKNGIFTDEEAPKKSITDGMTKALSLLGFAADIHMGLFDDNKYVATRKAEEEAKATGFDAGEWIDAQIKAVNEAKSIDDMKPISAEVQKYRAIAQPNDPVGFAALERKFTAKVEELKA